MYDRDILINILTNILWSIDQILKRFHGIKSYEDFINDDAGLQKLDSICMQLINIGEALKQIDKLTNFKFLANYPEIDWKRAKGMRDIIAHHYFDIDAEAVFTVCSWHIPEMKKTVIKMLVDLRE